MALSSIDINEEKQYHAAFRLIDINKEAAFDIDSNTCIRDSKGRIFKILHIADSKEEVLNGLKNLHEDYILSIGTVNSRIVNKKRIYEILTISDLSTETNQDDLNEFFESKKPRYKEDSSAEVFKQIGYSFIRRSFLKGSNVIDIRIKKDATLSLYKGVQYEVFAIYTTRRPKDDVIEEFIGSGYELARIQVIRKADGYQDVRILGLE